jgi:S1-C subfamily serine protease
VRPTLRVEATIGELGARLCALSGRRTTGALVMTVTWKLFAPTQDAPLAIVQTHASGDAGELISNNFAPLLEAAFRANVQALAADPAFQKALKPPPRRRSKPRPPHVEAPLADMRLGLVAASAPMPFGQAAQGVVSIIAGSTLGSGVLITADGYLLTNEHVVGRAKAVTVRWPDGTETPGEVVRADKRRDVALVKTEPPKLRPLAIRRRPVTLAETVYAIGTPRETDFAGTLTRGVVSTVQRVIGGQAYIQSDVAIAHGNSGGPLLDEKGAIVGLSVLIYEPGGVPQNINFFVPIDEALKALAIQPGG